MGDCKHFTQGYCYFFSDNRTKEFCENECEHNCGGNIDNSDLEMDCLICNVGKERACADCCRDWDNEVEE